MTLESPLVVLLQFPPTLLKAQCLTTMQFLAELLLVLPLIKEMSFLISDGGTLKKITVSNLEDTVFGNISGDATVAAGGAMTLAGAQTNVSSLKHASLVVGAASEMITLALLLLVLFFFRLTMFQELQLLIQLPLLLVT